MTVTDSSPHHRIRKATFDLQTSSEKMGFAARKVVADLFERSVVPVLHEVFDQFAGDNQTHRIDHLEIDLGRLSIGELDENRIQEAIRKQLLAWLRTLPKSDVEVVLGARQLENAFFGFLNRGIYHGTRPSKNSAKIYYYSSS